MPKKITFRAVLLVVAVLYVVGFLMSGQLFQLSTNWFTQWMSGIFRLMDSDGFFNVWSGQTPGTHYLYFLTWKPAQAFADNPADLSLVFSLLWFIVTLGALFLGTYLFYKIIERLWGETRATILATVYLVLSLTFEWYVVIDSISLAALLGAIYFSLKGSGKLGGIFLAVSAVIKPIGIVVLPVLLMSEFVTRKTRIRLLAAFIASSAAMILPFAIGNFKIMMSSLNWQSGRPPWETVYSFGLWLLNKPIPHDPFFQDYSGIVQRDWGWAGITPVHSVMTTPVPGYNPWYNTLFLVLMIVAIGGFLLFKRIRNERDLLWGGLYAIGMYFALFYGWSTQFFFWLAPFMLATLPLGITIVFKIIGWLEYPLFYGLYLARIAPDLASSIIGMPVSWTSNLASAGPAGFWTMVLLRTFFIFGLNVVAWRKLPVREWRILARWRDFQSTLQANMPNFTHPLLRVMNDRRKENEQ